MKSMIVANSVRGIVVLLLAQAITQAECTRRARCEEKVALQEEIRILQKSQEVLGREIASLRNTLREVNDLTFSLPEDCSAAKARGSWSTTAMIRPPDLPPRMVRCEQQEQGGGWTIILARRPTAHPLDFNTTWQKYRDGFGSIDGEFWIGNEVLHALTKEVPHQLRVTMKDWNDVVSTGTWKFFMVASEEQQYELRIGDYDAGSTACDALKHHNGSAFSAQDFDNDRYEVHCAQSHGGGWWYSKCYTANPTGVILNPNEIDDHGMMWRCGSTKLSLKSIIIMIKPTSAASYSSLYT